MTDSWQNKLYTGDNLYILHGMNSESVDLIYLDPPFNSKRTYSAPIGSKSAGASFKDMWTWNDVDETYLETLADKHPGLVHFIESIGQTHSKAMMAYITYMTQRILECYRVLRDTGSLYLHCDPTASHYLKIMLDEVFGKNNFRNEIIWYYRKWTNSANYFQKNHDIILCYAKNCNNVFFNKIYQEPTDSQQKVINKGYNVNKVEGGLQLFIYNKDNYEKALKENKIDLSKYIKIIDKTESEGSAMNDVWEVQYLHSQSKERTGYPTQKPLALLERIIKASSKEGDVVLDPFCGCATTCVAAEHLGRKWIGIDIEKQAVKVLIERLTEAEGQLFKKFINTDLIPKRTDLIEEIITKETKNDIKNRLFTQQNGHCNACDIELEIHHFEIDHIIPKAKGGGDYFENYQLLCGSCNKIKGDRPMDYLRTKIKTRERMLKDKIIFGG